MAHQTRHGSGAGLSHRGLTITTISVLRALMDRIDSIQEQKYNTGREKKVPQRNDRTQKIVVTGVKNSMVDV